MPRRNPSPCWLLALALLLPACRPGDAPKEPAEPNDDDPKVSASTGHGGVGMAFARRGQAVARL
jgi:hypothetical protein